MSENKYPDFLLKCPSKITDDYERLEWLWNHGVREFRSDGFPHSACVLCKRSISDLGCYADNMMNVWHPDCGELFTEWAKTEREYHNNPFKTAFLKGIHLFQPSFNLTSELSIGCYWCGLSFHRDEVGKGKPIYYIDELSQLWHPRCMDKYWKRVQIWAKAFYGECSAFLGM